ncbi:MAG: DUF4097 family beta strand repeat-containing protein [Clostridia bacterium]
MNSLQKIIKYGAIAFAIILIVGIISSIASAIFGIGFFLAGPRETKNIQQDYTDFNAIEINNGFGDVEIIVSDKFSLEANNLSVNAQIENNKGKLVVNNNEQIFNLFGWNLRNKDNTKITIKVPADVQLTEIVIKNGAGKVEIADLSTTLLKLETGVGKFSANNLTSAKTEIDGGVGEVRIEDSKIGNLYLKSGVGDIFIGGDIAGNSRIECGVGKVAIELIRNIDEYDMQVKTGLGDVKFNQKKVGDQFNGNITATDKIAIDGGVGEININFPEEIS